MRAGTIRRVGAHRRWDADGLDSVRGVPWQWDPDADEVSDKLLVHLLSDDENVNVLPYIGYAPGVIQNSKRHALYLRLLYFGFACEDRRRISR